MRERERAKEREIERWNDINSEIERGKDVQELRELKFYTDLKTIRGR